MIWKMDTKHFIVCFAFRFFKNITVKKMKSVPIYKNSPGNSWSEKFRCANIQLSGQLFLSKILHFSETARALCI